MNDTSHKTQIQAALSGFTAGTLADNARHLLRVLGYESDRTLTINPNTAQGFLARFNTHGQLNPEKALLDEWETFELLFQLTEDELNTLTPSRSRGTAPRAPLTTDATTPPIYHSYLFLAVKLRGNAYSRNALANITREVNKRFAMPAMLLFQHGQTLTFAIIHRRTRQHQGERDVLEKVSLIKDIDIVNPHRAHIEILADLALPAVHRAHNITDFFALHQAWQKTLDSTELNKRFFRELANWYFWAVDNVTFPNDAGDDVAVRNATSVIRLITRLIFVWFLKEKDLIPDALFDETEIAKLLHCRRVLPFSMPPADSTYYKAILQNLFFATLNQEMNTPEQPNRRQFREEGQPHDTSLYLYKRYFREPDAALRLFESIPFLNGGLFDCLDKPDTAQPQRSRQVDGFSDMDDNPLRVPNELFFADEHTVDLNAVYGTKNRRYTVRGIIHILNSYKFTIAENTPIEEEVALDPELLGRVFENLLAAYNPETGTTARKQTGSFYTPREIVNYMVDASLLAYFTGALIRNNAEGRTDLDAALRHLLAYTDEPHQFTPAETERLITAIDTLNILDPACGSGAFPMGILHKLVFLLSKLDPGNAQWRQRQLARVRSTIAAAEQIDDSTFRESTIDELERELASINEAFERNELDYGRKLYLIENCIYGVDIQPIATQIAKLRVFISLIVAQRLDDTQPNRGVRPLPNLETKFVAANTLLGIEGQLSLRSPEISEKERQLEEVRRRHFTARTPQTKERYRQQDKHLRTEISALLAELGLPSGTAQELASWEPYNPNAVADFFDAEWMFGISEGFDIVIGNPPYVRADAPGQQALRQAIKDSAQYETLSGKWDLYIPFIERSYKLLKPGGFTTLIVSDAYCHAKYALKSQEWFRENSRICRLDFFRDIQIFDATVRNIIYLFQRADGSEHQPERRVHAPEFGSVNLLQTDAQQNLTHRLFFPEDTEVQPFAVPTMTLDTICYISVGMVVHANKQARGAFGVRDLVSDVRDETHPKPFVEGKHLARWLPATNKWLEWGTERAPALFTSKTFPELYEAAERLISADMAAGIQKLKVSYDDRHLRHNQSAWSFTLWHDLAGVRNRAIKQKARYRDEKPQRPELPQRETLEETSRRFSVKFLLGVMNSTVARDFLMANRRSNIHIYPDDWKKLPIPNVSPERQAPVVALVDAILSAKRADFEADVSALEAALEREVAALYGILDG